MNTQELSNKQSYRKGFDFFFTTVYNVSSPETISYTLCFELTKTLLLFVIFILIIFTIIIIIIIIIIRVKQDFPRLNSYRYFIIGMYIEIFIF